ncbi:asparagine synthase (glutamine-hydrolysing) [Halogranum rubrum]|uniref:Asparagine synthase (Glutamine-hydrolysing) n=1 Tax=Halogranum rubrum TaxID=553466 RepID=A0A1I4CEI1_9EURY|nr:asparagine synthase-related protein [Halogranum rubrum]SFK78556.1 asparagine synthase (glutamine-hydrolysing) [Halogranum rubrum]
MSSRFESNTTTTNSVAKDRQMNRELFGVFGDRDAFDRLRAREDFDDVLTGNGTTVGIRDSSLDHPRRSARYEGPEGMCAVFGELIPPTGTDPDNTAEWLLDRFSRHGFAALTGLNGSYIVVIDHDDERVVVTDPLRSWECFYADVGGVRVFSTDPSTLTPLVDESDIDREAVLEFLHLGTVLGTATVFDQIRRVPFDGYLTATDTTELSRFVYEPRRFDYVDELATRLEQAIERRAGLPGPRGLLLSGGKDSRVLLSKLDIDQCYTVGRPGSREVRAARKVAEQYGAAHEVLAPDDRYLRGGDAKIRCAQGIKESLHIHHAGYDDEFDVATMYHGALFDTLLKGYFLERDGVEMFGSKLPSKRLHPNPNPIDSLLDTLGFFPEASEHIAEATGDLFGDLSVDDPTTFLQGRLSKELDKCWSRTDSVHNAMDLLVIRNQPVMPFRTHLADNYYESFIAADIDLLEWHLKTPPEHRHDGMFWEALERIDPTIFHHRPPSQPYSSTQLNQIERFVRRKVPVLEPFESAWPDRDDVYDRYEMDRELFPTEESIHQLPVRQKLRVNDLRWWLK